MRLLLLVSICTILLASCSTIYIPNSQTVPLFEEKKQVSVQANFAVGDQSSGLDIQGAVSVTNHFAVMANGYFGSVLEDGLVLGIDGDEISPTETTIPYNNFEVGAGFFTPLGASRGIFEVYAGWGMGGPKNTIQEVREYYQNNHFFIQPNIGGKFGNTEVAFSTRINYGIWKEFSEVFIEPALTFRFGWEKVKFQFQLLGSFPFDGERNYLPFSEESGVLSDDDLSFAAFETIHTSFGIYVPLDFN